MRIGRGSHSEMTDPARLTIRVGDRPINLTQLLKLANCVQSGGEAKAVIDAGHVCVNGEVERRKRRQMKTGDIVAIEGGETIEVCP
jgi:ribosome-associated protein